MQRGAHLVVGELGALEVFLEERVVTLGGGIDQRGVRALDLRAHLVGDGGVGGATAIVELVRTVVDQVDVAAESVGGADRHRNRDRLARERLAKRIDRRLVGGVLLVHAVHDDQRRDAGRLDHLPGHLGADLHGPGGGDDEDGRVGNRERLDDLAGEVLEPGCVDEVHAVAVPVAVRDRQPDAHRVALLLGLVVEERGRLLGRPHALRRSGGVQQGLAEGRLAVVAVSDDGDGADAIRCGRRHGESTPNRTPGPKETNGSRSHRPSVGASGLAASRDHQDGFRQRVRRRSASTRRTW